MIDFLKTTFNNQAELYNEVRPHYPQELFNELERATGLSADAQLLEIAPGTGQATESLAQKDYSIVAVELGDELANVARRELREFHKVKVITNSFEEVELPSESFDLVYCATAFHWIKPEVKFSKTHSLLKDKGYLAIINTHYVSDKKHDEFFKNAQSIFKKYDMHDATAGGKSPVLPSDEVNEVTLDTHLFEPTLFKVFPGILHYTADNYIKLLCTFSTVIAMDDSSRNNFLSEIRELSNNKYQGMVTIPLKFSLTLGRKIG